MIIEGESKEVSEGDAIYIPPNHEHGIKNIGSTVLKYLTANSPVFSKEYEDSLWPGSPINK
jgi:mannose-6-phosphate isomerase-like protein (cupin superfamily)